MLTLWKPTIVFFSVFIIRYNNTHFIIFFYKIGQHLKDTFKYFKTVHSIVHNYKSITRRTAETYK